MLPTLLPIGALFAGIALLLLGSGLLNTVVALRGSIEGFSDATLGLIGSTYFLGFFLGTFIAPRLIRRMGHIRAFAFFGAAVAACMLLHALIVHPAFWMLLRVITGIALVGFYAVIESWLNEQTVAERRGKVFAVYMAVNLLALAAAQQMLRLDGPENFTLFAVAAIFVCLSLLPVTMTRLPQPKLGQAAKLDLRMLWRAAPAAFVGAISSGVAMGAFWSLGPIYGERIGLDAGGIAVLMTSAIIGGALLQWPIGHLSDSGDRRRALGLVAAAAAITGAVMVALGSFELVALIGFFVFGGAAFTIYPIVVAHLIDHLHQQDILAGNTGILFLHGAGAAIGPMIAGGLLGLLGPAGLPLHFAIAFAPLAVFALMQAHRKADEIIDEAAHFAPMLRTSATVLEMVSPDAPAAEAAAPTPSPNETGTSTASVDPDSVPAPGAATITPPPPSAAPTTGKAESPPPG
ncbi:MAG TPA: MFS transporter [Thauera sp.]|nr:MFS transporter [Thauera sp.]